MSDDTPIPRLVAALALCTVALAPAQLAAQARAVSPSSEGSASAALQALASRYPLLEMTSERDEWVARIPDGPRVRVRPDGSFVLGHGGEQISLHVRELARETYRIELGAPAQARWGAGIIMARGEGLSELVALTPRAVEHALTLESRPPSTGLVEVRIDVDGARASVTEDGAILLEGRHALYEYGRPIAWDARGRQLSCAARAQGSTIVIDLDDRAAQYPIVIDPEVRLLARVIRFEGHIEYRADVDGSWAIVGALPREVARGPMDARVLHRTEDGWAEVAALEPPVGATFGGFQITYGTQPGGGVAIAGGTAFVGAPDAGDGAAYVYGADASGRWALAATLTPSVPRAGEHFGLALAASGDRLVVAARERVIVFERSGTVWIEAAELPLDLSPAVPARFARSVAIAGDLVVVAKDFRRLFDEPSLICGSDVFEDRGGTWQRTPIDGLCGDPRTDGTLITGHVFTACDGVSDERYCSRAVVFGRAGSPVWAERARLAPAFVPGAEVTNSLLGWTAAFFAPGRAFVSASRHDPGGAVFEVAHDGREYALRRFGVRAPESGESRFGSSLAADEQTLMIGADDALYVFALESGGGCSSAAECSSGHCVDGVCCDAECGGGDRDDCMACSVAAGGSSDGTCGPLAAHVALTRSCRPAVAECDAPETCSPIEMTCPADVLMADGAACRADVDACERVDECRGGACVPVSVPRCDDGDPATCDRCESGTGACIHEACGDGGGPPDAGAEMPPPSSSSCGCRVVGVGGSGALWLVLALFGVVGGVRRRRGGAITSLVALSVILIGCTERTFVIGELDAGEVRVPDSAPITTDAGASIGERVAGDVCADADLPVAVSADGSVIAFASCTGEERTVVALHLGSLERFELGDATGTSAPVVAPDGALVVWESRAGIVVRRSIASNAAAALTTLSLRDVRFARNADSTWTVAVLAGDDGYGIVVVAREPFREAEVIVSGAGVAELAVDAMARHAIVRRGSSFVRASLAAPRLVETLAIHGADAVVVEDALTSSHALVLDGERLSLASLTDASELVALGAAVIADPRSIPVHAGVAYFVEGGALGRARLSWPAMSEQLRPSAARAIRLFRDGSVLVVGTETIERVDPSTRAAVILGRSRPTDVLEIALASGWAAVAVADGILFANDSSVPGAPRVVAAGAARSLGFDGRGAWVYWLEARGSGDLGLARARPSLTEREWVVEGVRRWWPVPGSDRVLVAIEVDGSVELWLMNGGDDV